MSLRRPAGLLMRLALTAVLAATAAAGTASAATPAGVATLVLLPGVSFEGLMRVPAVREAATPSGDVDGGAALMAVSGPRERDATGGVGSGGFGGMGPRLLPALINAGVSICRSGGEADRSTGTLALGPSYLAVDRCEDRPAPPVLVISVLADPPRGLDVRSALEADVSMMIVASPVTSPAMRRVGDETAGLVYAHRSRGAVRASRGGPAALASDTTRRVGLVADVDVPATVLDFFGVRLADGTVGSPIQTTDEPAPFDLHRRHLEQRRVRLPIQFGALAIECATLVLIAGVLVASMRRRQPFPSGVAALTRFAILVGVALVIPMAGGGLLPRLDHEVVVPYLVGGTLALAALAHGVQRLGPTAPLVLLGAVGIAVPVVDLTLLGGRGLSVPLLGGTMFDGVRFYGLPNAFIALLVGSGAFVAAVLPRYAGGVLLLALGLFAGFPDLGANLGASVTLLVAAGVWWALAHRDLSAAGRLGLVAAVATAGVAVVLLANRYLADAPTHVGRFLGPENGPADIPGRAWERLLVGVDQVVQAPAAILPLVALPVALWLVIRPPPVLRSGLEAAGRRWRHAVVALTVAAMAAFLANDTGVAAAAPAIVYAIAGIAYPALGVEGNPEGTPAALATSSRGAG